MEQLLKQGVEIYTGRNVTCIEVHRDPKVPHCYAMRAWLDEEEKVDFLLQSGWKKELALPEEAIADHLEEAEFTTWPPTSGALKIFV